MHQAGFSLQLGAVLVEHPDPSLYHLSGTPGHQPIHRDSFPASLCTRAANRTWSFPW